MDGTIKERIGSHRIIGLDTSILIYHLENNVNYQAVTHQILDLVESERCRAFVSTVSLMELTVLAWRADREDVARQYETLLVNFPNMNLADVTRDVARQAARLRARFDIRPADALLVSTAQVNGATAWITNDKKLRRLDNEINVILLDEFID